MAASKLPGFKSEGNNDIKYPTRNKKSYEEVNGVKNLSHVEVFNELYPDYKLSFETHSPEGLLKIDSARSQVPFGLHLHLVNELVQLINEG